MEFDWHFCFDFSVQPCTSRRLTPPVQGTHHSIVYLAAPRTRPSSAGEWFVVDRTGLEPRTSHYVVCRFRYGAGRLPPHCLSAMASSGGDKRIRTADLRIANATL